MTGSEKFGIFLRLHALQVSWNFKGMQHLGFLYAIRPVLARLWDGERYLEAEKRQVQYFNTHPYFAPICAGVVARLEEDLAAGSASVKADLIPVLKNRMSGPLAAVGDAFFWETLRPVMASLAVLAVYAFGAGSFEAVVALLVLGAAYVLPVTLVRWQGLGWGYDHGLGVVEVLKRRDFQGSMRRIRNFGAILMGGAAVAWVAGDAGLGPERIAADLPALAARAAILLFALWGALKKWSPTFMLYLAVLAGVLVGAVL